MKIQLTFAALVVAAAFVLPAVALAHRAPTGTESKAIKAAVKAYIKKPRNHAAHDNKVVKILISTVDSHFAGAKLTSVSGDSTALLKGSKGSWKVIGFGPGQSCSLASKAVRADIGVTCGNG